MVNPVVRRIRALTSRSGGFVMKHGTERDRRVQRILNIVIDEAMEELATMDETGLAMIMTNIARVAQWAATGNIAILPADLIPFACEVDGITVEQFAASAIIPDEAEVVDAEIVPDEVAIEALWLVSQSLHPARGNALYASAEPVPASLHCLTW